MNYTDRARKVLIISAQEATKLNQIPQNQHVFLALLKEGSGRGAQILESLGLQIKSMTKEFYDYITTPT